jgi:hypothetical protein
MKRTLYAPLVLSALVFGDATGQTPQPPSPTPAATVSSAPQKLTSDTPHTTAGGATFTAPKRVVDCGEWIDRRADCARR